MNVCMMSNDANNCSILSFLCSLTSHGSLLILHSVIKCRNTLLLVPASGTKRVLKNIFYLIFFLSFPLTNEVKMCISFFVIINFLFYLFQFLIFLFVVYHSLTREAPKIILFVVLFFASRREIFIFLFPFLICPFSFGLLLIPFRHPSLHLLPPSLPSFSLQTYLSFFGLFQCWSFGFSFAFFFFSRHVWGVALGSPSGYEYP